MTTEYRRVLALSNIPVTGSFIYREHFQILPVDADAPTPPAVLNHHPLVIEFCFTIDETPREGPDGNSIPQWIINNDDASKTLKEILLLLTAFSNDRVFTYSLNQSWYIPMGIKGKEPTDKQVQWGQEGYTYDSFKSNIESLSKTNSNPVDLIDANDFFNRYGRSTDQEFDLPDNIDELLDSYFALNEDDKHYFLSSCSLFGQGEKIWSEHPSLSFAAFVSSIETLIAAENKDEKIEKCNECGQDRYRILNKFREFFGRYGSPTPEFRKYAIKVYKYRSKILHRGELFLGEVAPRRFGSIESFEDDEFRRSIIRTCRICFVNWLINRGKNPNS